MEAKEFRYPDVLREHGIVSLLNVPVRANGHTWGVLEVDSTRPSEFDEWDISFLTEVANIMGVCLALSEANQKYLDAIADAARERTRFDIVVRELQHRIKNNLAIIISVLSQKVRELSPDIQAMFNVVIGRIQSVALAHDLLSVTSETSSVAFDDYLRSLCANIFLRPDVALEVDAEHVSMPIDRAVPAGLIVNELVTNAVKYAFGNSGGHIKVRFAMIGNRSEACVSVQDDGRGMDLPPKKGLGLSLVERLAQQIQGHVQYIKADPGTRVVMCFPVALRS
jgi:two-component sensor histidine kinase